MSFCFSNIERDLSYYSCLQQSLDFTLTVHTITWRAQQSCLQQFYELFLISTKSLCSPPIFVTRFQHTEQGDSLAQKDA